LVFLACWPLLGASKVANDDPLACDGELESCPHFDVLSAFRTEVRGIGCSLGGFLRVARHPGTIRFSDQLN
jgi:hypothetical protein